MDKGREERKKFTTMLRQDSIEKLRTMSSYWYGDRKANILLEELIKQKWGDYLNELDIKGNRK